MKIHRILCIALVAGCAQAVSRPTEDASAPPPAVAVAPAVALAAPAAKEPSVPDRLADACHLEIKLVSETVTLPDGRRYTLRSCVLGCRADQIKYLEIAPNGCYLVFGRRTFDAIHSHSPPGSRVFLIDLREGKLLKKLEANPKFHRNLHHLGYNCDVVFSPDSSRLATILHDFEIEVLGISPETKPLRLEEAKGPEPRWVRWSPDGSLLACLRKDTDADPPRTFVDVWDGKTGKKLCRFEGGRFVFPPDGKTILTDGELCRLWDARTGKLMGQGKASVSFFGDLRVRRSPAGRLAVFQRCPRSPYRLNEEKEGRIFLVSRRTGKELLTITAPEPSWPRHSASLYPSDKYLAVSYPSQNFLVARAYSGENFQPGRFTAQIWDLSDLPAEQVDSSAKQTKLSREELERAWGDLATEENYTARDAMRQLLDASGQLATFLGERIKPVPPLLPGQLQQWIADLDSNRFETRQAAEQGLTEQADLALPAVEQRLATKDLPLEVRRRAERIVERLREDPVAGETGRLLWVVELLEQWGTPEAKTLLKRLASGAPDAWVTLEAKASLELLDRKK